MAERNAIAERSDEIVQEHLLKAREVLMEAAAAGWPIETSLITGKQNDISGWRVVQAQDGGHKFTQVASHHDLGGAFKVRVSELVARPKIKIRHKGFFGMRGIDIEVQDIDFDATKNLKLIYASGPLAENEDVFGVNKKAPKSVLASEFHLTRVGESWVLEKFKQQSWLSNSFRENGTGPILAGSFAGEVIDGQLYLAMSLDVFDKIDGKDVDSSFRKLYKPVMSNGNLVYKAGPVSAKITSSLPEPFNVSLSDQERRIHERGHANAARIARVLPSQLTPEQVAGVFSNIADGKVFTRGILKPWEIRRTIMRGNRRSNKPLLM